MKRRAPSIVEWGTWWSLAWILGGASFFVFYTLTKAIGFWIANP